MFAYLKLLDTYCKRPALCPICNFNLVGGRLRAIKQVTEKPQIKSIVQLAAADNNIAVLWLYGSQAKGNAQPKALTPPITATNAPTNNPIVNISQQIAIIPARTRTRGWKSPSSS